MKILNKILRISLVLSIMFTLFSVEGYAIKNTNQEDFLVNKTKVNSKNEKVDNSIIEYSYKDEHGDLVSSSKITTYGTNSVLWNQSYKNENSIKKEINAINHGMYAKPGKVNINIKNTGKNTINVNIYQSWWNSRTLAYFTLAPGSSKTVTIGSNYGGYDCHINNCFAYQRFTISVYAKSGKISFNGYAKIFY